MLQIDGWVRTLFDSLYDGILIIDEKAIVRYINPAYTHITRVTEWEIVGQSLNEVRPGARLADVLNRKEPIVGALRQEEGVDYTVNMSPIVQDGAVVGGISVVSRIEDVRRLSTEINKYRSRLRTLERRMKTFQRARYTIENIIAEDPVSLLLKQTVCRLAEREITVLLFGESGTGKELYAQALHNASGRRENPFVAVNCATFSGHLLESELFGYEEGAFTGAKREGKMGLFEAADTGTIFLDEISEMSWELQGKLLRVLQERTVRRVGGVAEIPVNIRILAATNKNLEERVEGGTFREDLYYRIAIYPLTIPPLRKRRGDILPLAQAFLEQYKNDLRHNIAFSKEAKAALYKYDWPGNVRELRNAVEFAVNTAEGSAIEVRHLPGRIQSRYMEISASYLEPNKRKNNRLAVEAPDTATVCTDHLTLHCNAAAKNSTVAESEFRNLSSFVKEAEQKEIRRALAIFGSDVEGKKRAAKVLGISLASLYNKLKESEKR